jgi:D-aspartate ligase
MGKNLKSPPALVIPADRPASLGVARSLGRRGIQVYGVDSDPHEIGMASRYLTPCPLPGSNETEENRLQFLVDLGKKLGDKTVLYPVSDDAVMLCSQYRDELQKYYQYVMPDHKTISSLLTKDGLHQVAQAHNIPDPQMFQVCSREDINTIAASIPFPVILKPVFSPSWLRPEIISMLRQGTLSGPPKVALCRTLDELLETYSKLSAYDNRIIIQEVIPGDDDRLFYICFYLDRKSTPLALFAGEKIRVLPVGFGSATYVRSMRDSALEEIGLRLLAGTHYQGMGGIEFKKDTRDDRYKLIEFNARLGMWDSFGAKCGVDIPYIAYCDALGIPIEPQYQYREGVFWIDFQRDVRAFLISREQGRLSLKQWVKSLFVEKEWAVYARDDWKPALMAAFKLFDRPLNTLLKR